MTEKVLVCSNFPKQNPHKKEHKKQGLQALDKPFLTM